MDVYSNLGATKHDVRAPACVRNGPSINSVAEPLPKERPPERQLFGCVSLSRGGHARAHSRRGSVRSLGSLTRAPHDQPRPRARRTAEPMAVVRKGGTALPIVVDNTVR